MATVPVPPAPKATPPPKTTPPARRQVRQIPAAPAPAPATPPPAAAPASPAPQLGEFLTTAQRRQFEADFLVTLQRSRAALARIDSSNLNAGQRDTAERIRVFIDQADAERARDIATALQLARRADLLGQDLLKSLSQ